MFTCVEKTGRACIITFYYYAFHGTLDLGGVGIRLLGPENKIQGGVRVHWEEYEWKIAFSSEWSGENEMVPEPLKCI